MSKSVKVFGAQQHNLKKVDLEIPKNKLVIFTGVSGSGKSSLVFDTIAAEAQRQLIETFSAYARRRLPKISRPNVEEIQNLSPVMVIDQKRLGTTLRSTVGTVTEIYNYLRLLYSRIGEPFIGFSSAYSFNLPDGMCSECNGLGKRMKIDLDKVVDWDKTIAEGAIIHSDFKKGGWYWKSLLKCGFYDPHKPIREFSNQELHDLLYKEATKYTNVHQGEEYQASYEGVITKLKRRYINSESRIDAYTQFFSYLKCDACQGTRINSSARSVKIHGTTIPDLVFEELPVVQEFLSEVDNPMAKALVDKMSQTIQYLIDIGVGYLSLHRSVATLSGGESQRVKMAKQLDCNLVNLIYILDEPSIGLHPKDIDSLIHMLKELRDNDNSIFVVEHDASIIASADHVIDIGPKAGVEGGEVLFSGSYNDLLDSNTTTAAYLKDHKNSLPEPRKFKGTFSIKNAKIHNLKNIDIEIPKGVFVCITGVAGSGKSSLINHEFLERFPDSVVVDQSAVGRSNRSNPMTYVGIFDQIRKEFALHTGQSASLFSFNSKGACQKCKGIGIVKVEMSFLDDVKMVCDECQGKRYTDEVLSYTYKGKNIYEVLELTVRQALEYFEHNEIIRKLKIIKEVGLHYLKLGQSLSSLSGGEAQRIKLSAELHKKGNVYIMDEPTTGLHMADTERLMQIINKLVNKDNSVIVIEHNLDVIKRADWIIDLGPEGGKNGGYIIAQGIPEEIAGVEGSYTGQYLRNFCNLFEG